MGNGKIYVCPYPNSPIIDIVGNQTTVSNTSPVSAYMYLKL